MAVDRSRLPSLGPDPRFTFPDIRRLTLDNGARAWTIEHRDVPLVNVLVLLPADAALDPPERPGLAAITGDLLDEGSGDSIIDLLLSLCHEEGCALVLVTHNAAHAARCARKLLLREGGFHAV